MTRPTDPVKVVRDNLLRVVGSLKEIERLANTSNTASIMIAFYGRGGRCGGADVGSDAAVAAPTGRNRRIVWHKPIPTTAISVNILCCRAQKHPHVTRNAPGTPLRAALIAIRVFPVV